jgi:hypothetical protein
VATLGTVLVSGIHAANAGVTDPGALARGALSGYHPAFLWGPCSSCWPRCPVC